MPKTTTLRLLEKKIDVQVEAGFKPSSFFKDRDGLYVFSSFADRILTTAKDVKKQGTYPIASYELTKAATDEEIEMGLPKKHTFTESEVCAIIASLIEKQPKGEKGVLLNDGWWNLFYTPAFVVYVRWSVDGWCVYSWPRGGYLWFGSFRVFSPAN